ncbi:putative hydrolase [Arthrobacter globiformis NBRC 12137]|uniref:Putative hydrolase n=1 Tax=Arthrobacter globiformis (strain ATCC 8010 / DSM 20124 / JCM 1332 / NBRC 12137 / NCIMB 8907 / NRRL B-2979 / 168) TaxID=1077972 RepID=H0QK13_ARTG1|nr:putative hydrolase [Arthrobacter globiformis NBRC 12137]
MPEPYSCTAEVLAQFGIDPAAVADVIVTHGHYDQIGNFNLFPNARIHMSETEYRF